MPAEVPLQQPFHFAASGRVSCIATIYVWLWHHTRTPEQLRGKGPCNRTKRQNCYASLKTKLNFSYKYKKQSENHLLIAKAHGGKRSYGVSLVRARQHYAVKIDTETPPWQKCTWWSYQMFQDGYDIQQVLWKNKNYMQARYVVFYTLKYLWGIIYRTLFEAAAIK